MGQCGAGEGEGRGRAEGQAVGMWTRRCARRRAATAGTEGGERGSQGSGGNSDTRAREFSGERGQHILKSQERSCEMRDGNYYFIIIYSVFITKRSLATLVRGAFETEHF